MGLSAHINVFNTCLRILAEKGYAVRVEVDTEWHTHRTAEEAFAVRAMFAAPGELEEDPGLGRRFWMAEKDGFYFCAGNPIELLGLVAVRDHLKPAEDVSYWWRTDGPDLHSELLDRVSG